MSRPVLILLGVALTALVGAAGGPKPALPVGQAGALALHPDNPHYFTFRNKPTLLIASGEHYGAVINPDFDYKTYLDTLQREGGNLTRAVAGSLCETTDTTQWRGGEQNPLAPRKGKLLAPWARSTTPGYRFGGNKFDLDRWDDAYFKRLKDFVREADRRDIVVEFNLFYAQYGDGDAATFGSWKLNPLRATNNINGVGNVPWHRVNTLADPALVARQVAVLRKTVAELAEFGNVTYEICDEPYFSGASPQETNAWQARLIDELVAAEKNFPVKHLIAVNYANGFAAVEKPHPAVSVLNFHYANPPAAVPINYHLNKVVAFDETSNGHKTTDRRREAWKFLLAGGAVFNNLDPSFATDDPTGSGQVKQADGVYDGRPLRAQLKILRDFLNGFDFVKMRPDRGIAQLWPDGDGEMYALVEPGQQYALYIGRYEKTPGTTLDIDLPAGHYRADWLTPATGMVVRGEPFAHPGGPRRLVSPAYEEDIALKLVRDVRRAGQ